MPLNRIARVSIIAGCCGVVFVGEVSAQRSAVTDPVSRATPPIGSPTALQQQLRIPISVRFDGVSLEDALVRVSRETGIRIGFGREVYESKKRVTFRADSMPGDQVLATLLKGTGLRYGVTPGGAVVIEPIGNTLKEDGKTQTVAGRVLDSVTKKGIAGATITIVGTKLTTISSDDGRFVLREIPPGTHNVTVKLFGYRSVSIPLTVGDEKPAPMMVVLASIPTALTEVITTATGSQRRVEVANDIAKVNADSLMRIAPARSVSDLLAVARIPGVEVTPSSGLPGSPSRIRLRGVGSMSRSNDPVVIVDGIWINAATSTSDVQNQVAGGLSSNSSVSSRLDDIDPNSIETIEVLRGPSASSLYGTDAANGVIIITTKRGQAGKTRWSFTADRSWNSTPGEYQPSYRAFGRSRVGTFDDDCRLSEVFEMLCVIDSVSPANALNRPLLTDEAPGRDAAYSASVNGGSQSVQYALTVSRSDQLGALTIPLVDRIRLRQLGENMPSWMKRPNRSIVNNLSAQITMQPTSALQFRLGFMAAQNDGSSGGADFDGTGIPGNHGYLPEDTLTYARYGIRSGRERITTRTTSGKVSLAADWRPWSWFMPNFTLGIDRNTRNDNRVTSHRYCIETGCDLPSSILGEFHGEQSMYTANLRSAFPLTLGRWERFLSIKPSVGVNLRKSLSSGLTVTGDSLPLGSEDLRTAARLLATPVLNGNSATGGWYMDFQIGIWQRFYTTMGFRQDVGSALSTRISPPTYPTIGTSWLISDEGFFPKNNLIPRLRLRLAYGHSAIQPDISAIRGGYENVRAIVNGQIVNAVYATSLGNFKLRPERAIELEYGFEADLLGDRTQISVTVATKRNRDQLVPRQLGISVGNATASEAGYIGSATGSFTENISRVLNRSAELSFSSRLVDRAGTVWSVNLSGSTLLNRVEKIGDQVIPFGNADARIVEGYPLNSVWAYPVVAYNDVNRDGLLQPSEVVIGDTLAYIGWGHPRYALNYGTTLQLLNGRFNLTANFAHDGQLTQYQQQYDNWGAYDPNAPLSEQAKPWTQNRPNLTAQASGNRQMISVTRFSNASATFMLPDIWARQLKATTASVTLQGQNLGLWTQYRGRDPGVNSSPIGEKLTDNGTTLPQPRKYALSFRLNF